MRSIVRAVAASRRALSYSASKAAAGRIGLAIERLTELRGDRQRGLQLLTGDPGGRLLAEDFLLESLEPSRRVTPRPPP
jgi:hypothetical protein